MISGISFGTVYTFFFVFGLGFAIISAIFTSFSGGHGHDAIDQAGHHELSHPADGHDQDVHADHHSGDGHDHGDYSDASHLAQMSMFSPLTASVFATSFGGFGILWQRVFAERFAATGAVLGSVFATIVAMATFYLFASVFRETQGTSNIHPGELVGVECDLAVGITEANPIGQAVIVAKGRRQVAMAKSFDGAPISKNRRVTIVRADRNFVYVKE